MNTPTPDTAAALAATLLPCPFCGGQPHISQMKDESLWSHETVLKTSVHCGECDMATDYTEAGQDPEAVEKWNTRAALASQPAPQGAEPTDDEICDMAEKHGLGMSMSPIGAQTGKVFATERGYWTDELLQFARALLAAAPGAGLAGAAEPEGEKILRRLLAVRVAGAMLYVDDGELQDNTVQPCIDFKRDTPEELDRKLLARGVAAYEAAQKTAAAAPQQVAAEAPWPDFDAAHKS